MIRGQRRVVGGTLSVFEGRDGVRKGNGECIFGGMDDVYRLHCLDYRIDLAQKPSVFGLFFAIVVNVGVLFLLD